MYSQSYLLGLLSAKLTTFLTQSQYLELIQKSKSEITTYLYYLNVVDKKCDDFESFVSGYQDALKEEVESYIEDEHPIYIYFFDEYDSKTDHYNKNYEIVTKIMTSDVVDTIYLINNFKLLYRLNFQTRDVSLFERNFLKQNIYSFDTLALVYKNGKDSLIKFVNEYLQITINKDMSLIEIDRILNRKINDYIKILSQSESVNDLIFYYIWMKYRQLEKIKGIYYLGVEDESDDII